MAGRVCARVSIRALSDCKMATSHAPRMTLLTCSAAPQVCPTFPRPGKIVTTAMATMMQAPTSMRRDARASSNPIGTARFSQSQCSHSGCNSELLRPACGLAAADAEYPERPLTCITSGQGPSPLGSPDRIRTGATALRGRRARPLHNGAKSEQNITGWTGMSQIAGVLGLEPRLTGPEPVGLPITPYPMGTAHCEPGADFTGRRCTRPNRGSHRPRVDRAPGIRCHVDHVDTGRDVPHEGAVAAQQLLVDLDAGTSIDHRAPDLVAAKVLGAETDELLAA